MLDEKYQELLTAYVDGELSARQRRAVQKLLRRSAEARNLLRKLQEDSHSLLELPPPPPAPDFADSVMLSISQHDILLPPRRPIRPKQGISLWAGLAAAAAVLLAIGATSYLLVSALSDDHRSGNTAHRKKNDGDNKVPEEKPAPRDEGGIANKKPEIPEQPKKQQPQDPPSDVVKNPDRKPDPQKPDSPEKKPDPLQPDIILGAPSMEIFQPGSAEVALPSLFKMRDFGQETTHKKFLDELGRYEAFYLDVLCREPTYAFPRLQSVLQAGGFELIVDHMAQERLKQPQFKTNYCVYLEDVTPAELARLLEQLGQEDPKADKKKPAFGQYASSDPNLVVIPMGAEHRRRVTNLLGGDLKKPGADQPSGKAERLAIALPYIPNGTRPATPEIKRFLDGRKPARKGTLQVLLVLRGKP
jgi:hypothetical protein